MAILLDEKTKVLVQGITGAQASFHVEQMLAFGTSIVAGVSPGKSGQKVEGVPVYETIRAALEETRIDASILFVPALQAKDAAFEAIEAGIKLVVMITEHIPVHDTMEVIALARSRGSKIIGPNTFGIISPGKSNMGIMPNSIFLPGNIGVISRSGTLCYELVNELTNAGLGQSTVLGLGGDRIVGVSFIDALQAMEADPETDKILMVGEIGGSAEEEAAEYIKTMSKPVVAYLAGKSAPPGKRMGHAGAIIERGRGTYESKVSALQAAKVTVASLPWEVPDLLM